MKKRFLVLCMMGVLAAAAVGCGDTKQEEKVTATPTPTETPTETPTPTPTEEPTPTPTPEPAAVFNHAEQTDAAHLVMLTNQTDAELTGFLIKAAGTEEWSEDYLAEKNALKPGEQAALYYLPKSAENGTPIDESQMLTDIQLIFAGDMVGILHNVNVGDMDAMDICLEDGLAFAKYNSILTEQEVNMKETEAAVAEHLRQEAERKAQEEAERKAQEEAEKKAQEEAAAAAQNKKKNNSNTGSSNNGGSSNAGSSNNTDWSSAGSTSTGSDVSQGEDNCAAGSGEYIINEDGSWTYVE